MYLLIFQINQPMKIHSASRQPTNISNYSSSIADELTKLGKLREQGVITEQEFVELKKDVLDGIK
jgi:hypothetical protein